jgi:hypothetical protein
MNFCVKDFEHYTDIKLGFHNLARFITYVTKVEDNHYQWFYLAVYQFFTATYKDISIIQDHIHSFTNSLDHYVFTLLEKNGGAADETNLKTIQKEFQLTLLTAIGKFVSDCNLESKDLIKSVEESIEEISTQLRIEGSPLKQEYILQHHEIFLEREAQFQREEESRKWVSKLRGFNYREWSACINSF